jgi:hypothetical protein
MHHWMCTEMCIAPLFSTEKNEGQQEFPPVEKRELCK